MEEPGEPWGRRVGHGWANFLLSIVEKDSYQLIKGKMGCVWGRCCIQRWKCTTRYPGIGTDLHPHQRKLQWETASKGEASRKLRKVFCGRASFERLLLIEASQGRLPTASPPPCLSSQLPVKELRVDGEEWGMMELITPLPLPTSADRPELEEGEIANMNIIWSFD